MVTINDADPRIARSRLAEALTGQARTGPAQGGPAQGGPAGEARTGTAGENAAPQRAVALLDARIVVNAPPLGAVLDDPRIRTAALSRAEAGQQVFLGVLRIAAADRAAASTLVSGLAAAAGTILLDLTRALAGAGVVVQPIPLGGYAWSAGSQIEDGAGKRELVAAVQAVAAVDERRVRLREAARGGDGFYSTFVLRKLSWRLTGLAERSGMTPNQVTLTSFALGLLAAGLLAGGTRTTAVLGAILLQVCLVFDCVDGELARFRRRFSRFGAWLDASTDRVKEFAAIAGLAAGAGASGRAGLWWLVAAAITVQTFRNLFDLGWALSRADTDAAQSAAGQAIAWVAPPSRQLPPAPRQPGPGANSWLRRIGHFPIGERFLLMSLGAALLTPRPTLILLVVAGLLSAGYMLAAYAVRGGSVPAVTAALAGRIAGLADLGPVLAAVLRRIVTGPLRRLGPVLPAAVAAVELALIWLLGHDAAGGASAAVVLLVAVTAIAHYQRAYQVREQSAQAGRLVIGTDLRLCVLLVVTLLSALMPARTGGRPATVVVCVLALVVALNSTARSLRGWRDREPQLDPGGDSGDDPGGDVAVTATSFSAAQPHHSVHSRFRQTIGGLR